jgi:putative nucleotidyltransferase with HDIG domain
MTQATCCEWLIFRGKIPNKDCGDFSGGAKCEMIKKVSVERLKPGMYIHDLDCGWLNHPFLKNNFMLRDEKVLKKIMDHGIREVYIDTDRGMDCDDGRPIEEVQEEIQREMENVAAQIPDVVEDVPLHEELVMAREIRREARQTIHEIMEDIRFGKEIKTEKVEAVVDSMIESILRNQDALISLGRIKKVDEYTYMHCVSVGILMLSFGRHLGFDMGTLREAGIGAMLHDVGKMKVPDKILTCRRSLSDEEYEEMKRHVEYGVSILDDTDGITETSHIVASQHHERLDGSGYPAALRGDGISVFGQAVAIVDVYDAMTSRRCYQRQFEPTDVLKKLFEWSPSHFNPELVQKFIKCIGIYPVGTLVRLESGLLAVVLRHGERGLLYPVVKVIYDTKKQRHLMPFIIDLSNDDSDRVAGYESPDRWNLKPEMYL